MLNLLNSFCFCLLLVVSSHAWSAQISTVKEKKAAVIDAEETLAAGDEVLVMNESSEEVGRGIIKRRQGKKVLLILKSGEMKKGQQVVLADPSKAAERKSGDNSADSLGIVGYGGIYSSSISPTPIAYGGDLKYPITLWSMPMVLRGGVTYWSAKSDGVSVSAIDFAGAVGLLFKLGSSFSIETGARLGYASLKFSASFLNTSSSISITGVAFSPYVGALYHINDSFALGAESRLSSYFTTYGTAIGDIYLLGQLAYNF